MKYIEINQELKPFRGFDAPHHYLGSKIFIGLNTKYKYVNVGLHTHTNHIYMYVYARVCEAVCLPLPSPYQRLTTGVN